MGGLKLDNDLPGIVGPMVQFPHTGHVLSQLAEALLNNDTNGLSRYDREMIATYVSHWNNCDFCAFSHAHFAAEVGRITPEEVWKNIQNPPPYLRDLFRFARLVVQFGTETSLKGAAEDVRRHGFNDAALHDVALIASAFCMFNRYVEAVGGPAPDFHDVYYSDAAKVIARRGYTR